MNEIKTSKRERLTIAGFLMIVFLSLYAMYPGDVTVLYSGFATVIIVTFVAEIFSGNRGTLRIPGLCKNLMIFTLYSILSFSWAIEASLVIDKVAMLSCFTLFTVVMTSYFLNRESEKIILYSIAIIGISLSIYVIVFYGGLTAFYEEALNEDVRVGAEITNVNSIGLQCAYSSLVLFYFALYMKKNFCYLLFVMPTIVTAASGSRKAMLVIIIGVILLVYFKQQQDKTIKKYIKYIIFGILLTVIIIYILQFPIMNTFTSRMETMFNFYKGEGEYDSSTATRSDMVSIAFKQFLYKPFLGIGLGNSVILNAVKLNRMTYTHNDYMEILVNGGIVGFILYYSIYFKLVRDYIKLMKRKDDSTTIICFVLLIVFLLMNWGNVTYYNSLSTYLYLTLWITHLELNKEKNFENVILNQKE